MVEQMASSGRVKVKIKKWMLKINLKNQTHPRHRQTNPQHVRSYKYLGRFRKWNQCLVNVTSCLLHSLTDQILCGIISTQEG